MLLERIQLKNLLSFGPDAEEFELRPLNVLIGPNGSGKSNLIEAIGMLQAAPTDLAAPTRAGRGVGDWIWQGEPKAESARIEAVLNPTGRQALRYAVEFAERHDRFTVIDEELAPADQTDPTTYFKKSDRKTHLLVASSQRGGQTAETLMMEYPTDTSKSVLAQVKDPQHYPELTCLGEHLERIGLYREWTFGPNNVVRSRQRADLPTAYLAEDNSNLGLVLNCLSSDYDLRRRMVEALHRLYKEAADFHVNVESNTVRLLVQEREGVATIPASRLSDGTIRYLSLLATLCHPKPPPLVCIEEPDNGLHPDAVALLADLIVEASERTQLVVTTHSDALVGALTSQPDAVVVCERPGAGTDLRRLDPDQLSKWLDDYGLGDLWRMGELGANP